MENKLPRKYAVKKCCRLHDNEWPSSIVSAFVPYYAYIVKECYLRRKIDAVTYEVDGSEQEEHYYEVTFCYSSDGRIKIDAVTNGKVVNVSNIFDTREEANVYAEKLNQDIIASTFEKCPVELKDEAARIIQENIDWVHSIEEEEIVWGKIIQGNIATEKKEMAKGKIKEKVLPKK